MNRAAAAAVAALVLVAACTESNQSPETTAEDTASAAAAGSASTPAAARSTSSADAEQAIRDLDARWSEAAQQGDAAAFAGFYAQDGRIMPPNGPAIQGPDAIQQAMGGMLQAVSLSFEPTEVHVSAGGDMAYEVGTWRTEPRSQDGAAQEEGGQDNGKYVVVWQNVDGEWKVVADIFNSNQPAS